MTTESLFVRVTNIPDAPSALDLIPDVRPGGGLDLGPGGAISAGFPPSPGAITVSRPAGVPVRTPSGLRAISVEDLGWTPNPRPPGAPVGGTGTRISPYSSSNPISGEGLARRAPSTRAALGGIGLSTALDIGYEIAQLEDQFTPFPCPEISDADFYRELGIEQDDIRGRLARASSLAQLREVSGSIARVSGSAALGFGVASFTGLAAPLTVPAAVGSFVVSTLAGGVNLAATQMANQGRRNDRNLAIFEARGSTARRYLRGDTGDCPLPSERQLLNRIFDCCFPELAFTVRRDWESNPVPGTPPRRVAIVDVLVLSNQQVGAAWLKWTGGSRRLDVSDISRTARTDYTEYLGGIRTLLYEDDGVDFGKDLALELVVETGGRLVFRDFVSYESGGLAVIPDWWALQVGGGIPQLLIQFGEVGENGKIGIPKYSLTIPWYAGPERPTVSPVSGYQKGKNLVEAILPDNTRVRVFSRTMEEGERMVNLALAVVDPAKSAGYVLRKSIDALPNGQEITVAPKILKWFPTGQKDLLPTWEVRL